MKNLLLVFYIVVLLCFAGVCGLVMELWRQRFGLVRNPGSGWPRGDE